MLDLELLKEQAEYYANVPILDPEIIASVHLENADDELFWDAQLQREHSGKYNFIYHSKAHRSDEYDSNGCEQCLRYRDFLSPQFFICIDSDMRHFSLESDVDAKHYIAQTYTYSWENHCCEVQNLNQRFAHVNKDFDFHKFLLDLSQIVYLPVLYLLYYKDRDNQIWNIKKFKKCIPTQVPRKDLANNGENILLFIKNEFEKALKKIQIKESELKCLKDCMEKLGLTPTKAYLFMQGHSLYNLVSYIGSLLCRGESTRFDHDILNEVSHLSNYTEIDNILSDLNIILRPRI